MADAHRVSASCTQDDTVRIARQRKLESVKENNFFGLRCALRRTAAAPSIDLSNQLANQLCIRAGARSVSAFHNGEPIALG
jgi:hypothetical protein